MLEQYGDVFRTLAQRRNDDREDPQAEVEVGPELSPGQQFFQVPVGGGDDADIDADGLRPADPFDLFFLQHPQQAHLGFPGQLSDFVQEDRASVGPFEAPAAAAEGTGERTLLMAEKLAVHQGFRNGAAVDADERPAAAGRAVVDGVGHDLFAHAGLAEQQHGTFQRRHLPHQVHDALQAEFGAHHLAAGQVEQLVLKITVVVGQQVAQLAQFPVAQVIGQGDGKRLVEQRDELDVVVIELDIRLAEDRYGADEATLQGEVQQEARKILGAEPAHHGARHGVVAHAFHDFDAQ